jgi:mannosyltransferase OCH1-like enzyme
MDEWGFILLVISIGAVMQIVSKIRYHKLITYHLSKNISECSHSNGSEYIPKNIYQLIRNKKHIHQKFQENIDYIKKLNPTWNHILYDDDDIERYICKNYPPYILQIYNRINPSYGAAKADFFRYLLMYKEGGVYLDIKSAMVTSLDDLIKTDDEYILSHWYTRDQRDILKNKLGEYQQWHIICRPWHPFLKSVIDNVIKNIENYDDIIDGVGKPGVLRLTGPIIYTQCIIPMIKNHNVTIYEMNEYIGLIYNNTHSHQNSDKHMSLFDVPHYSKLTTPIIL